MSLRAAGFPDAGQIFPVHQLSLSVADGDHPFVTTHADQIDASWQDEISANPAFFNGELVLQRALTYRDGALDGLAHRVNYSALLFWRRQGKPTEAYHLFSIPVLVSSDGHVVAIRMARNTANPGLVYCAAGSLDLTDIIDGMLDPIGNMIREVTEETGLDLTLARAETAYHGLQMANSVILFKRYYLDHTAEDIARSIEAHVAGDEADNHGPEIDGPVILRHDNWQRDDLAYFMPAILTWHFSNEGQK